MPPLVYTSTTGTAPSPVELSTPSQNVVRPVIEDLGELDIDWMGVQRFLSAIILGTQQNEVGPLPLAGTINDTTNRLYFLINGDGEIRTLTPASGVNDIGRLVKCYIVGSGIKRVRNAFAGGGIGRIQCPNNIDYYIGNRGSFDLVGDGGNGWLMMNPSAGATQITVSAVVPAVAALTLAYLDVPLATTGFAGLTTNQAVAVNPRSDLAPAGLNGGSLVSARISATDTLRLGFLGALAGGAANFTLTKLGP
jgi:hypothetical protein